MLRLQKFSARPASVRGLAGRQAMASAFGERLARGALLTLSLVAGGLVAGISSAAAQARPPAAAAAPAPGTNMATPLETSGAWTGYASGQGAARVCYALAKPRVRLPANLNRDPAFLFVSVRPAQRVRGEVSWVMGFGMREGAPATASIGNRNFQLVTKGDKAWVGNPAEEPAFVQALLAGSELEIKVVSARGNNLSDKYPLSGFGKVWERVSRECP